MEKRKELGVIFHRSERSERNPRAPPCEDFVRYRVGPNHAGAVRVFNTFVEPDLDGIRSRLVDVLSCKRIVSTSFHGCVLAESYGIPWLYFRVFGAGVHVLELLEDERVDIRYRDLFTGMGVSRLAVYGQRRDRHTDWDDVIRAVDRTWSPIDWKTDDLLASFPLPIDPRVASGEIADLLEDTEFRSRLADLRTQQFSKGGEERETPG